MRLSQRMRRCSWRRTQSIPKTEKAEIQGRFLINPGRCASRSNAFGAVRRGALDSGDFLQSGKNFVWLDSNRIRSKTNNAERQSCLLASPPPPQPHTRRGGMASANPNNNDWNTYLPTRLPGFAAAWSQLLLVTRGRVVLFLRSSCFLKSRCRGSPSCRL